MWQRCSSLDMDTIPSVLAHGAGLSSATSLRVQAPVRTPPSNWLHEMATCRLFNTKVRTSIRQSTLHSSFFENLASSYHVVLLNL